LDLSNASKRIAALSVTNTQLTSENTQLRDMQQRLQARLSQLESSASASTIGEASATASLSYAHRLAVEMARVTDIHIKSIEKVRSTANSSLPYLKNGGPLSPMLQNAYDSCFKSPKRLSLRGSPRLGEDATVKMMESRIKELETALKESSEEMGEVVCKMQLAQIEMIELAGERDEAVRRERKLLKSESIRLESDDVLIGASNVGIPV
jgi:predicted RNase H-like nuclease (RuvC/YqgF family)